MFCSNQGHPSAEEAHLRWTRDINWEEFVHCQVTANEIYTRRPSVSLVSETRDVLMNAVPLISGGPLCMYHRQCR